METHRSKITVIMVSVIALLGISLYAFADWERGYGRHDKWADGDESPRYHQRGGMHGYWNGYLGDDIKDEDIKKLNDARQKFLTETQDLRSDINEKEFLIRNELSRSEPDANKVIKLQKQLSALRANLDEKWVNHMIAMKKINPDIGRGYAMGHGPGYGRGQGRGHGRNCWR